MFLMPGSRLTGFRGYRNNPGRKLIYTLTANNSTTLSGPLTANFTNYEIVFRNFLPATNSVDLRIRVITNVSGTPTVQTSGYLCSTEFSQGAGFGNGTQTTFVAGSGNGGRVSNTASNGVSGSIRLFGPVNTTTNLKIFRGTTGYLATAAYDNCDIVGTFNSTNALLGLQFDFSSGNITSGFVDIIGMS